MDIPGTVFGWGIKIVTGNGLNNRDKGRETNWGSWKDGSYDLNVPGTITVWVGGLKLVIGCGETL